MAQGEITSEAMKEVEVSAASLEDELQEIGGDELSQALANAISQLTSDFDLDKEIDYNVDPQIDDDRVSKVLDQESTSSMDLGSFDSLKDLRTEIKPENEIEEELAPEDSKSLEDIFSSALNDLTSAFGVADLDTSSENLDNNTFTTGELHGSGSLTADEEYIYLEINKKYANIMKDKNFYVAMEEWKVNLPDLLKQFNISEKKWNEISEKGDKDEKLSEYLAEITK
jgi:hypothetical protein